MVKPAYLKTAKLQVCYAAHYTWKSELTGRLRLTSSNCQTLNPHLDQMQGSWWYLLYKPRYSPFCLKFCCLGNKGRSG